MGRAPKAPGKPKGKMSAYAFFMQATREERRKKSPNEALSLCDFSKQASEKWKNMSDKEKKKYEEMAAKDSLRYKEEMADYVPTENGEKKRKRGGKDPNAPKRALSAFFCFSNEERSKVKAEFPAASIGDIAKELGKRWETCKNKEKYEAMAAKDKERYEKEKASYNGSTGAAANGTPKKSSTSGAKKSTKAKAKPPAKKSKAAKEEEEEEDEEADEDDENQDEDESD